MDEKNNDKMLIYQSEDGEIKIDVRLLAIPIWYSSSFYYLPLYGLFFSLDAFNNGTINVLV